MKKENFVLFVLPIVMVFVGLIVGFYFGIYQTSIAVTGCEIQKALIAPSPIVKQSVYDEKTHTLKITIANPGYMPIALLTKSLVLKPKDVTKKPLLIFSSIPLGITLPPNGEVELDLNLQSAGSGFVVGDVLETTLTYSLPVSNDVYAVVHRFEKSSNVNSKGMITNKLGDNETVLKNYETKLKTNKKVKTSK